MKIFHIPVLKDRSIEFLQIKKGGIYVDATCGGGGHTETMFEQEKDIHVMAFDHDKDAIDFAQKRLSKYSDRIIYVNKNFSYLSSALALNRINKIDGILFDLGFSSHQINQDNRGFSYTQDDVLDMRMNRNNGKLTAFEIVNFYMKDQLEQVLHDYSEDRFWKRISNAILQARKVKKIETTKELREIIESIIPKDKAFKTLSRVFQALRIEVNKELDALEKGLKSSVEVLKTGGRIAVISYHSLEDRIVKQFFKYENLECICPAYLPRCVCEKQVRLKIITKKPIIPSKEEIEKNSRARSAKLRVAERC
ncbi:MAG: 16S rRNA (cytosine(1402)-N(4))-methyltransferase RsmH [Candidatus Celaenobacter polaris]|nr:16S rRNA (cytosine(1402)-N(4))-methyltransferase RsmH [Candidatus Celaenobacter polaris]